MMQEAARMLEKAIQEGLTGMPLAGVHYKCCYLYGIALFCGLYIIVKAGGEEIMLIGRGKHVRQIYRTESANSRKHWLSQEEIVCSENFPSRRPALKKVWISVFLDEERSCKENERMCLLHLMIEKSVSGIRDEQQKAFETAKN
ncbi:hypothetical protein NC651_027775 [Populus alba x Populus x berolinensis]|nr:hypothetical protein NC651_027775 [Populus alba x Populus x berolinensis]